MLSTFNHFQIGILWARLLEFINIFYRHSCKKCVLLMNNHEAILILHGHYSTQLWWSFKTCHTQAHLHKNQSNRFFANLICIILDLSIGWSAEPWMESAYLKSKCLKFSRSFPNYEYACMYIIPMTSNSIRFFKIYYVVFPCIFIEYIMINALGLDFYRLFREDWDKICSRMLCNACWSRYVIVECHCVGDFLFRYFGHHVSCVHKFHVKRMLALCWK